MCDLCDAVKSAKYKSYGSFILVPKCRVCGVPMLVLKRHKPQLDTVEKVELKFILKLSFKDMEPRGIGMRSNSLHYHEHLVKHESD